LEEEMMCGRFGLGGSATTLIAQFNVQENAAWTARYNLAPSQDVLTVVQTAESGRQLRKMRWGLIPAWAKDPGIGNRLINARAETVATKPAFRRPLRERRCLILTDGFYEWESRGGASSPGSSGCGTAARSRLRGCGIAGQVRMAGKSTPA
jgi:putative SOS response-associated peptidase YedK